MTATARWSERRGWRAFLFIPPKLLRKAADPDLRRGGPVILDLEDAVPTEQKRVARRQVGDYLQKGPGVYVRINASTTEWFREDLEILNAAHLLGVFLPKAESPEAVAWVRDAVDDAASVIPLIETAAGLEQATILSQSSGVERLAFGALDFRRDLQLADGPLELLYARARIVVASRAAGLLKPLDSVDTDLAASTRFALHARRARRLGFGGKLCVHPAQVRVVNRELKPTASRMEWALRVLDNTDGHEPRDLAGELIDAPIIGEAMDLLEEAAWPQAPHS